MGQPLETHIRTLQERYWSEADPDGRAFVSLADALRRSGDLVEAHRVLREGLGRHPESPSGHVVAAWLARDRGEEDEAESEFRRVLELDPWNVAALKGLGGLLRDRGDVAEALEIMEVLRREDPSDQDLPAAIQELRTLAAAPDVSVSGPEDGVQLPVWEDPEGVEEEVDLSSAVLQADSTGLRGRTENWAEEDGADQASGPQDRSQEGRTQEAPAQEVVAQGVVAQEDLTQEDLTQEDLTQEDLTEESRGEAGFEIPEPGLGSPGTPVVEDGEPMPAQQDLEDAILTPTLGEIYLRQGLFGRAAWVFESLLEKDPDNRHLHGRLEEVRELQAKEADDGEEPDGPPSAAPTGSPLPAERDPFEPAGPPSGLPEDPDSGHPAPPLFVPTDESGPMDVVSIDSLAPDRRSSPPGPAGESTAVEAWTEGPARGDPEEEAPALPVSIDHLASGAPVSIDHLAPEVPVSVDDLAPEVPVSVDDLAPGAPISIDDLAPEAPVSIDHLAPGVLASIDDLAPDGLASIDALAPDVPVSLQGLAPAGIVSIDDLAPDSRPPSGAPASEPPGAEPSVQDGGEDEPTLDEFERWLDKLQ